MCPNFLRYPLTFFCPVNRGRMELSESLWLGNLGERIIQFRAAKCSHALKFDGIAILARANGRLAMRFRLWFIACAFVDFLWKFFLWKVFHDIQYACMWQYIHVFSPNCSPLYFDCKHNTKIYNLRRRKHKQMKNSIYVGCKENSLSFNPRMFVEFRVVSPIFKIKIKSLIEAFCLQFF